jgi:hypothetical protein
VTAHAKISARNEIVCQRSDGTYVVVPLWMLDPDCSGVLVGEPLIAVEALRELRRLLTALQSRGKAGIGEALPEGIDDEAHTQTSTTSTTESDTRCDAGEPVRRSANRTRISPR